MSLQVQIYEQLDKLDDFLIGKSNIEKSLLGTLIGSVLAVAVYFSLFDISNDLKLSSQDSYSEINNKVVQEEAYIATMENGGLSVLEQRTRVIQNEISKVENTFQLLGKLTDEIYVHSKDWFLTFDDASRVAVSMGLVVNGTDIKMSDKASLGGMKYSSFILFGYGTFSSILKYIAWLETYGKFISIDNIIMESKDNRLNFSVSIRNFRGGE